MLNYHNENAFTRQKFNFIILNNFSYIEIEISNKRVKQLNIHTSKNKQVKKRD